MNIGVACASGNLHVAAGIWRPWNLINKIWEWMDDPRLEKTSSNKSMALFAVNYYDGPFAPSVCKLCQSAARGKAEVSKVVVLTGRRQRQR